METFSRGQQVVVLLIIFGMTLLYFHSINQPNSQQSAVGSQLSMNLPSAIHPHPDPPPSMGRGFEGKKISGAQLLTLNKKINLNTATKNDMEAISGIGPKMAEKIIDHRNKHGRFERVEDIMNIKGIKEKKFEKIKRYLTVK